MGTKLSSLVGALACLAVLASIVVFAVQADGRSGTETSSNDGGAWLVNRSVGNIGHVNFRVEELSSAVRVAEPNLQFDVFQPGDAVIVHDSTSGSLSMVDPRTQLVFNSVDLPPGAEVQKFDHGLVVAAPGPFRIWQLSNAVLLEIESVEVVAPLWEGNRTEYGVSRAGDIAVVDVDRRRIVSPDPYAEAPLWAVPFEGEVDEIFWDGGQALIRSGSRLGKVTKDGVDLASTEVDPWLFSTAPTIDDDGFISVVGADGSLRRINTDTGEASLLGQLVGGDFVQPVEHKGCIVALTHEPPARWDQCGNGDLQRRPLETTPGSLLRLRIVNGWVWINNVNTGELWFVDNKAELGKVDDWGAVLPQEVNTDNQNLAAAAADDAVESEVVNPDAGDSVTIEADEFDEDGINQPPIANDDDAFETHIERPIVIGVLANDDDPDNDVLLVADVENLSPGDATISKTIDGTGVQVSPAPGFEGTVQFRYTITDGRGGSDVAVGTVAVRVRTGVLNSPPEAVTDVASITAGEKMRINVLSNDYDPDGDTLLLVGAEAPSGSVRFDPSGLVIFEPDVTSDEGRIELAYTISDEFGEESIGKIIAEVRLKQSNQAPDARNDGGVTVVSQPIGINLLLNDTDPDGDDLFVAERPILLSPPGVDVFTTISPDGEFLFIPDAPGTYLFSYAASDDEAADTAQIRIEVEDIESNSPPVAVRDDVTIPVGESRIVYVLENDGDPDGDVVGIVDLNVAPGSGLRVESFFDIGFRVFVDQAGPAQRTFRYAISDGDSDPVETVVVVAVADGATLNQPPIAEPDVVDMRPGSRLAVPVLDNDFDPEGGSLSVVGFTNPVGASVEVGPAGQSLRIRVDAATVASFDIGYDVADEEGNRAGSVVKVRIVPDGEPNRPPVARPDDARVQFEGEVSIAVINNDSDPDGDAIQVESITSQPANGSARVDTLTNEVVYRPAPGFSGTDRLTYSVIDALGARSEGEVLVGVMPQVNLNEDPVAVADSELVIATGGEFEIDVLANDSDPDGDQLRVKSIGIPAIGETRIAADGGMVIYTAPTALAADGEITFDYSITDGAGGEASATVTVLVQATPERPDGSPTAIDDLVGPVTSGSPQRVAVVANDSDPDGPQTALTVGVFDSALQVEGQIVVFDAPAESTTYAYQVVDAAGNAATANIVVTVVNPEPPRAVDDSEGPVAAGETITIDVLANDSDPDGDVAELRIIEISGEGARHDGRLFQVVAPAETTQYGYTIEDTDGLTASATVSLFVAKNRAPVVEEQTVTTPFETSVEIDVAPFATDPDGDVLSYSCCQSSRNGTPQVIDAGEARLQVLFTPDAGFDGDAVFAWQVDDQFGNIVAGSVTVQVEEQPNRPPTAVAGQLEVQVPRQGAPAVEAEIDLAPLSDDPDEDDLTWSVDSAPGQDLQASLAGSVLKIVATDQADAGSTTATWTVTDPEGESASAEVAIAVTEAQNDPPQAQDTTVALAAGNSETLDLASLASDADTDEQLTYELTTPPAGAITATLTGESQVTVNAAVSASGESASFGFLVTDRMGESADGQVSIAVGNPDQPLPEAAADSASTLQGESVDIPVLANDSDPIGLGLTLADPGTTADGATTVSGEIVRFTPEPTFFGTTTFTYTARDGADIAEREAKGVVTIEVTGRPEKPGPPDCSPDSTLVNLTWTTPAGNGATVDAYEIEHDQSGLQALDVANSFAWEGLVNGTEYRFRLRAENAAGWSAWSEYSVACRPDTEPERPAPPQATHGNTLLNVSWTPPVTNGSAIEEYELRRGGGVAQSSVDTQFQWTGLTNGTDYTFQVRARNLAGWSEWSSASAPEHPSTIPAAPTIGTTTRAGLIGATASGILESHWSPVPVANDGGATITEYEVERQGGPTITVPGANSNSYIWSGLPNGVEYQFRVRAINRDGEGPWSQWSAALPSCTTPGPPTALGATRGDRQAEVTFAAVNDAGGCEVTHYDVRIAGAAGNGSLRNGPGSEVVGGLSNGTAYAFEVRANNVIGASSWVQTNAVTPAGLPICGSSLNSTSIGHNSVALQWSAANFNGANPQGYELQLNNGSWASFSTGTQGTRTGLSQNTDYTFEIRARNEIGVSPSCGSVSRLTCGAPPQAAKPSSSSVNQSNNSITVTWNVVAVPCTSQPGVSASYNVTKYEIDLDPGSPSNNGTSRSKTWTNLSSGTYRAKVRACNSVGCGGWSSLSTSQTIDPDCPRRSWTVYGQTFDEDLPGASIRSGPGSSYGRVGGLPPGAAATATAWTVGPNPYSANPYPQNLDLWVKLTYNGVTGYSVIAGVEGSSGTWSDPLYFDNMACRE